METPEEAQSLRHSPIQGDVNEPRKERTEEPAAVRTVPRRKAKNTVSYLELLMPNPNDDDDDAASFLESTTPLSDQPLSAGEFSKSRIERADQLPVHLRPHGCYVRGCEGKCDRYRRDLKPDLWVRTCNSHMKPRFLSTETDASAPPCSICFSRNCSSARRTTVANEFRSLTLCEYCRQQYQPQLDHFGYKEVDVMQADGFTFIASNTADEPESRLTESRSDSSRFEKKRPLLDSEAISSALKSSKRSSSNARPTATDTTARILARTRRSVAQDNRDRQEIRDRLAVIHLHADREITAAESFHRRIRVEQLIEMLKQIKQYEDDKKIDATVRMFLLHPFFREERSCILEAVLKLGDQAAENVPWVLAVLETCSTPSSM